VGWILIAVTGCWGWELGIKLVNWIEAYEKKRHLAYIDSVVDFQTFDDHVNDQLRKWGC
jgi:3-polyprenyl-4-hydroxybenzoate decarboxylase